MASVNKVILVGHLGNDPELRQTTSGQTLCKFRMATSRRWRDPQGEPREETAWHHIVSWGKTAELCATYLRKGNQVYIEGRLSVRTYDDPQGQKRTWTEVVSSSVVFLSPRGEGTSANEGTSPADADLLTGDLGQVARDPGVPPGRPPSGIPSEELPF